MEQLSRRGLLWGIAALAVPVWKPLEVLTTPAIWTKKYKVVIDRWPVGHGHASFIATEKDIEAYERLTDRLAEVMSAVSYLTVYRVNTLSGFFPLGNMMRPFAVHARTCETTLTIATAAEHKGHETELIDKLAKKIAFDMHRERNKLNLQTQRIHAPDILLIHSIYGVKGIKVESFEPTLGFVVQYAWRSSSDSKDARPLEVAAVSNVKRILTVPTAALTVGMADDVQVPDGERQGFALSYQSL